MAATVEIDTFTGVGPTRTTIDSSVGGYTTCTLGRDDSAASTTTVPIPTSTGTHFSYVKWLRLFITGTSTTLLSNFRIALSTTVPAGTNLFYGSATTYTQNNGTQGTAAGNYPTDAVTNGATPATVTNIGAFAALTTANAVYDSSTGVSTGSAVAVGKYIAVVGAVDNTYAAGPGATTMPSIVVSFDEQ